MQVCIFLRRNARLALAIHLACLASFAMASDMEVSLQVQSASRQARSKQTEEQPSPKKAQTRPVFTSKAHDLLTVSWKVTNLSKRDTFKDVLVHCQIVPEKELGQTPMPSLNDSVQESALTMDFKPGGSATGTFSLTIDEPGKYLVRIETRNMLQTHGHDHYAALDLVCQ